MALDEAGEPGRHHLDRVFAGHLQQVLAVQRGRAAGAVERREDVALDVFGLAFLDHEDRALAAAKATISSGTIGYVTFKTSSGSSLAPKASARPSCCSARTSVL